MADTEKTEKPAKQKFNKSLIGPIIAAGVFLPSTIVLAVMMLPTAIAAMVDKYRPRALMTTVGALNFSGATGAWLELFARGHSYEAARDIIIDIDLLLASYGYALVGLVIYIVIVPVVSSFTSQAIDFEHRKITKRQEHLRALWGDGVLPNSK